MAATQAKYILITTATRAEKDVEKYKTLGNRAGILALKLLDDLGFNNDEAFKIVRNTNPKLFYLYALLGYWTPNGINIGPGNQTLVPNYEDSLLLWNPGIPEISLSESDGQHRGYWSNPAAIDPEFQGPYTLEAIQQGYHIVFRILTNEILNMLEATSEDENNPRLKREQLIRLLSESGIDFEDVENMSNEDLARNTSWFLLYKEWLYLRFPYQSYYPGVICSFDDFKPEDA